MQSALDPPSSELRTLGAWSGFSAEEAKQARYRVRALRTQAIAASGPAGRKSAHARGKLGRCGASLLARFRGQTLM